MDTSTVLKRLFLGLTVLFFLAGFFFIIFAMDIPTPHGSFLTVNAHAFPISMGLRIGMILLLIVVTALCVVAVVKENNRLVAVVSVLLVIMLLVEFILSLKYLSWRTHVNIAENDFAAGPAMLLHYGFQPGITQAFDYIQRNQGCCGVNDFRDWYFTPWVVKHGKGNSVPESCCNIPAPGCGDNMDLKNPIDVVHLLGCTGLKYFSNYKERIFNGAAIGLVIVHVMAVLCAVVLACVFNSAQGLSFAQALKGEQGTPSSDSSSSSGSKPKPKPTPVKTTEKKTSKGGKADPGKTGKGGKEKKDKPKRGGDKYGNEDSEYMPEGSEDYLLDKSKTR